MREHKHECILGRGHGLTLPAIALMLVMACLTCASARAQSSADSGGAAPRTGSVTGLPIPRFVSIKADRVNLRRGPSRSHQVEWVLLKAGLPVEVTAEFENWRRIRDHTGDEGWVFHTLLSGRRTVLFGPWETGATLYDLRRKPDGDADIAAQIGPRVMADVTRCENRWCEVELDVIRGWVEQNTLWGVYPGEAVK